MDSVYFQYYIHHPSGDQWFWYYGRNASVGIEHNPIIPDQIDLIHNPAFNSIQIINNFNTCEIQCDLFTIAGSKLVSQSVHSDHGEINKLFTGHLPGGVYILRLSGGGYVRTGKIVVK